MTYGGVKIVMLLVSRACMRGAGGSLEGLTNGVMMWCLRFGFFG